MQRINIKEKRISPRTPAEFPLKFLRADSDEQGYGQAQDISAKGLGVITQEELAPDTNVELWLDIPERDNPLYANGRIVWSERLAPYRYKTGISLAV